MCVKRDGLCDLGGFFFLYVCKLININKKHEPFTQTHYAEYF